MERDWLEVNRPTQDRGQSIVAKVQTNQSNRKLTDPKLGSVDNPIMQKGSVVSVSFFCYLSSPERKRA